MAKCRTSGRNALSSPRRYRWPAIDGRNKRQARQAPLMALSLRDGVSVALSRSAAARGRRYRLTAPNPASTQPDWLPDGKDVLLDTLEAPAPLPLTH